MKFSFRARLVTASFALLLLVQGVNLLAVSNANETRILNQARDNLESVQSFFRVLLRNRLRLAESPAVAALDDFNFKKTMVDGDAATRLSAIDNVKNNRISADWASYLTVGGVTQINSGGPFPEARTFGFPALLEEADLSKSGSSFGIGMADGRLHLIVVIAVDYPRTIGYFVGGYELGEAFLTALVKALPVQVKASIIQFRGQGAGGEIVTSQLTDEEVSAIIRILPRPKDLKSGLTEAQVAGQPMAFTAQVLKSATPDAEYGVLFSYSLKEVRDEARQVAFSLAGLLALSLVVAGAGAYLFSASLSQPIVQLTETAEKVSAGDYEGVPDTTRKDEFGALQAAFKSMASRVQRREERLSYLARFDAVTGLPNRAEFANRLSRSGGNGESGDCLQCRQGLSICVLLLEALDEIHYMLGRPVGDHLLNDAARRLIDAFEPEGGLVGRIDAKHLALAFYAETPADAEKVGQRAVSILRQPFPWQGNLLDVYGRAGVVLCDGRDLDPRVLLQEAEAALYRAVSQQLDVAIFDQELDQPKTSQLSLMNEMQTGLENGEIQLFFQPKIDLKTGRVIQAEALVRWFHATRGFVPPDEFIWLAEQTGRIQALTDWLLKVAVKTLREWRDRGLDTILAVNISARDLTNEALPEKIAELLNGAGLNTKDLILEITESAVMEDPEQVLGVLGRLRDLGLHLSVDDFGTGQSSLEYLRRLPVTEIKIDRSFVRELSTSKSDQVITQATIDLGHRLGLRLTAEGVEDEVALGLLRDYGCDLAQGYFISRPIGGTEFLAFLTDSPYAAA